MRFRESNHYHFGNLSIRARLFPPSSTTRTLCPLIFENEHFQRCAWHACLLLSFIFKMNCNEDSLFKGVQKCGCRRRRFFDVRKMALRLIFEKFQKADQILLEESTDFIFTIEQRTKKKKKEKHCLFIIYFFFFFKCNKLPL